MRAASDLHLAPHNAQWVFEALDDLLADAKAFGGPTILCGDIFDQPKAVDMALYNRLRDKLRSFPERVVVIPGNHDQYDGRRNACEALDGDNVWVATTPEYLPGVGLCIPYVDPKDWAAIVAQMRPQGIPLVFAHQGFKGSYLNNMVRDRTGIQVTGLDGLVVVTGHYHCPQNVAQVIYCGSPFQMSHAETMQTKGFLAWPSRKRTSWVDWLPERRGYASVTAPRYWTVEWDGVGEPALPAGHRSGDIVRLVTARPVEDIDTRKLLPHPELRGAAIVAGRRPDRPNLRATDPVDAVADYIVASTRDGIDPADLRDFMHEENLWPGA